MKWLWWLPLLAACVLPGGPEQKPVPAGQGELVLQWVESRAVLPSAWAAAQADAYELLLVGSTVRAVDLTAGTSQTVAVNPGTWRVTVLVGIKRSSGSTTACLVASALAENVVVTAGQRSTVNLTLRPVDLALAPAGPAYWKEPVTVAAAGKSRNPRLGMQLAGASTTNRPRLKSVELWNGYKETTVSGTPTDWSAEASGTVPNGAAAVTVALVGAGLCFQDATDAWVPTAGVTKLTWTWPSRPELADTHPLVPFTETTVAATAPATGVDITLGWESP